MTKEQLKDRVSELEAELEEGRVRLAELEASVAKSAAESLPKTTEYSADILAKSCRRLNPHFSTVDLVNLRKAWKLAFG